MQDKQRKDELKQALGKVIQELRKDTNISARALSYGTNMSKTTLLLAEQGKLDPRLSTFCNLAEAFYKTPDELMGLIINELPEKWFQGEE
ncbi:MAG: helix-turn-helix domain-containing protein [Muribaculaceae bacterium]|nr:helix-turn-helix domain-containing protein [Muribaculaceae bacterium]